MNPFEFIFKWRQDRRDVRRDVREEREDRRATRQEVLILLAALRDLAPGEKEREIARNQSFLTLLDMLSQVRSELEMTGGPWLPISRGHLGEPEKEPQALLEAANLMLATGHADTALELIQISEDLSPSPSAKDSRLRAKALEASGKPADALLVLDGLIEANVERRKAMRDKCVLLATLDRSAEALVCSDEMMDEKRDATSLVVRAYVLFHVDDRRGEAYDLATEAAGIEPTSMAVLESRLILANYLRTADRSEAAHAVLGISEDNALAHCVLANAYTDAGACSDALTHAKNAVRLDPPSVSANIALIKASALCKDYEGLFSRLSSPDVGSLAIKAFYVPALAVLGDIPNDALAEGKWERAVVLVLSRLIEDATNSKAVQASFLLARGVVYLISGARVLADLDVEEALRLGLPKNVETVFIRETEKLTRRLKTN